MKAGDTVTLVGIPPNIRDDEELHTLTLFQKCLGRSFVIAAVESFEGVPFPLARIDVGHVLGKEPWEHTIWVEKEYLQSCKVALNSISERL
jgi:hypothetical protein